MALIDHVYKDASLTLQFDTASDTLVAQAVNGSSGNGKFYFGTPTATNKIQDSTDPGVNQIVLSITDTDGGVSDVDDTDIKLALSEANLATAVGGDPLNLGTTILGSDPAVEVWYQWTNATGDGTYTDIELDISERVESAI